MADEVKVEATAQNVPLGQQPVRPTVTIEQKVLNEVTGATSAASVYANLLTHFEAGLKVVEGQKDRYSAELRNHLLVWADMLKDLAARLPK